MPTKTGLTRLEDMFPAASAAKKPKGSNDSFLGRKTNLFNAANLGGLGGAALGASIGSVVPGIGTIIGGIIGAGLGGGGGELARQQINDEDVSIGGALKEGAIGAGSQFIGGKIVGALGRQLAKRGGQVAADGSPLIIGRLASEADTIPGATNLGAIKGTPNNLNRLQSAGLRTVGKFGVPNASSSGGAMTVADRARNAIIAAGEGAPSARNLGEILASKSNNLSGAIDAAESIPLDAKMVDEIIRSVTPGKGFKRPAIKDIQQLASASLSEGQTAKPLVQRAIQLEGTAGATKEGIDALKGIIGKYTGVTPEVIATREAIDRGSSQALAAGTKNVNTFSDLGGRLLNMAQTPGRFAGRKAGAAMVRAGDNLAQGLPTSRPFTGGAGRQITGDTLLSTIFGTPQEEMTAQNAPEQIFGRQSTPEYQYENQGGFGGTTVGFGSQVPESSANNPFSPEVLQQLALKDMMMNGGANLSKIKMLGDMFGAQGAAPKLGAAERGKLSSANASLQLIDQLEAALEQNPNLIGNVGFKQRILGPLQSMGIDTRNPQEQRLSGALVNALSELVLSVSGAAATDAERKTLSEAVPQMTNTPQQFRANMDVLRNRLNRIISSTNNTANSTTLDNLFLSDQLP